MSGNTQKVLLDSNAYFRLGNSIRPLLAQTFGSAPQYSLHVLAELDDEYATSVRLRHKFEWVKETEYCADRKARRFELNGKKHQEAGNAFTFLLAYADEQGINLSREDLKALAVGYVMGIPVVTDDGGMIEVATANGIECWSTIKLLRIMQTGGRIDLETVTQIIEYWDYDKDLPMSLPKLRKLYTDYFGSSCPI